MAKAARVQGEVVIDAIISKAGRIESLKVLSGPQMLRQAALDAVEQARYQPYRLNGEPVEVQTEVRVVFRLGS
jgi:protein TonB